MENTVSNEVPVDPIDILAVLPCNGQRVPRLVKQIVSQSKSLSNDKTRLQLLETARALVRALETPKETILRLCWAEVSSSGMYVYYLTFINGRQPTLYATINMGIDLGLFSLMNKGYWWSATVDQLSELTGCDATLLSKKDPAMCNAND